MPNRPNLLLITCDQLRHDFVGYAGAAFARTPNIDALAARGMIFRQACTNSPICTPARIGLASGMQPGRLGALDNNAYLTFSTRTYWQQLREAGYRVGCVGTLDLAKPDLDCGDGALPRTFAWGFTHPVECMGRMDTSLRPADPTRPVPPDLLPRLAPEVAARVQGGLPGPADPYTRWLDGQGMYETYMADLLACKGSDWLLRHASPSALPTKFYEDTFIAARSVQWLEEIPSDRPWHLFVSFVGPHDPFNAPGEFAAHFDGAPMPDPIPPAGEDKPAWIRRRARQTREIDRETVDRNRRMYSACIEAVDAGVGRIVEALERLGQLDSTVIVLTSDHGELVFDHGLMAKHCAYETSMRVPLLAAGPGIAAGASDALVELIDVGTTLCDLAGAPRTDPHDARSFAPVLWGESTAHRSECVCAETPYRAIRTASHKFIVNINDRDELYDLQADPTEQRNLADAEPALCAALRRRLTQRLMEGGCNR